MRILLISPPNPEAARLDKAFRESTHGVERVDGWRDGCFVATEDRFDAIVIIAPDTVADPAMLEALPRLAASAGGATIAAIVAGTTPAQRARMLLAGCDVCLAHPCSFVELHERLRALWRRTVSSRCASRSGSTWPRAHSRSGAGGWRSACGNFVSSNACCAKRATGRARCRAALCMG